MNKLTLVVWIGLNLGVDRAQSGSDRLMDWAQPGCG